MIQTTAVSHFFLTATKSRPRTHNTHEQPPYMYTRKRLPAKGMLSHVQAFAMALLVFVGRGDAGQQVTLTLCAKCTSVWSGKGMQTGVLRGHPEPGVFQHAVLGLLRRWPA